ncbi:MAG: type II secretion system F family protein [Candidatus Altiarchaeota archaeon]
MSKIIPRIYPAPLRATFRNLIFYSGFRVDVDKFLWFFLVASMVFSYGFTVFATHYLAVPFLMIFVALVLVFQLIMYYALLVKSEIRGRQIDEALPDFLQLMSANIKAGAPVHKAIFVSTRPEFGKLNEEIERSGKEMLTGTSTSQALMGVTHRFNSKNLLITMQLIISGMKSGGDLSATLMQIASILRTRELIKREVQANVLMYVGFIFFAIAIGGPVLFGVSSFLVEVLASSTELIANQLPEGVLAQGTAVPIGGGSMNISIGFIIQFSAVAIFFSSVMGSLIIGLINTGETRNGIKYIPIMIVLSISLFFIVRYILKLTLGQMIFV